MRSGLAGFFGVVFCVMLSVPAHGAAPDKSQVKSVPGQFLVRFSKGTDLKRAQASLDAAKYEVVGAVVPDLGLFLVKVKGKATVKTAVRRLNARNDILYAQPDHIVTLRDTVPDDTDFAKQWSLLNTARKGADIGAAKAWDFGTGGKDRNGNDVVIAIVDGGMDIHHKDLKPNLWVNPGEVPSNQIDDEGNGYVDDVNGWNAYDNNGTIPVHPHGTHVAGIAGASGNNGVLITGVNWNVRLMAVAASSGATSVVAAGYGYVLAQKKLWLQSKGKKGANIVATNSSFGVDLAECASGDYPVWNDLYNEMGKVGILSAAATANRNVNVDEKGDVPTSCSSEFLVKVTNTDREDKKYDNAGFGKKSIDIGAPGTAIWSTLPGDKAGSMTGTSMATPHVAGAIALLHSVASSQFQDLVDTDPAESARVLKGILLKTADPLPSLEGVTVSGGRLNLGAAAKAIADWEGTNRVAR